MTQEPNSGSPTAERVRLASMDDLMPLIRERLAAGQSVRISPRGVSMRPMLREGLDSVTLSQPPTRLKKYDIPLYLRASLYAIAAFSFARRASASVP